MVIPLIIEMAQSTYKRKEITVPNNKIKEISFKDQHFHVGIDVHKKRWVLAIREGGLALKSLPMNPSPEALKHHLETRRPGGVY